MSTSPVKRKLVAILAADAVGYSRLMAADEEGTAKILAAHRAVIDGIIGFHEGRIVGTAGDSVLAEFPSPVEAVRSAVEIQDALNTRNDSLSETQRLQFRIGINLGDVIMKGDDLLGDGVNVAARLESIAEPGGICISSGIYDQIAGKLNLGFVDIGAQSLKNIDRPIHVYRVDRGGRPAPKAAPTPKAPQTAGRWLASAAALVVLALALAWRLDMLPGPRRPDRAPAPARAADERARMEAELAKARAEVDEARRQAETEVKRALGQQQAAQRRAKAAAETARATVGTEASKPKGDAAPAGVDARRTAEGGVSVPAARYAGRWKGAIACDPLDEYAGFTSSVEISVKEDAFLVERGVRDQPGYFALRGTPERDGRLQLVGTGISNLPRHRGNPYVAGFDGRVDGDRYQAPGWLGRRRCVVSMSRADQ